MRWATLTVLLGGCASTQALEHATGNAQACEYRLEQVQADAKRLRATSLSGEDDGRAANAQAWADKIAIDCRLWRDQVAIEQARIDTNRANRQHAATSLRHLGGNQQNTISCTSYGPGNTTYTDCH